MENYHPNLDSSDLFYLIVTFAIAIGVWLASINGDKKTTKYLRALALLQYAFWWFVISGIFEEVINDDLSGTLSVPALYQWSIFFGFPLIVLLLSGVAFWAHLSPIYKKIVAVAIFILTLDWLYLAVDFPEIVAQRGSYISWHEMRTFFILNAIVWVISASAFKVFGVITSKRHSDK